jgi:hypothetical protein
MNIEIRPKAVFNKLLIIIYFLLIANLIGIIFKFYFYHDYVYGLVPLFNFDTEQSIPTLYSSFTLLLSSGLLFIIAFLHKRDSSYLAWVGLAVIMLLISIDETASIHEKLSIPIRDTFNVYGLLYYAWIIPYSVFLIILMALYFRFFMRLPEKVRFLLALSLLTFVSGAIGFESIGGLMHEFYGNNTLIYSLLYTCEEFLEMLGVAIFIYALLIYIVLQFGEVSIAIKSTDKC